MRSSDWRSDVCSSDLREARDRGRVDDAHVDHVAVRAVAGVVAVRGLAFGNLVQDHRRFFAGVLDDLAQRLGDRTTQDADADRLVVIRALELVEHLGGADQHDAAAGNDAFFDGRTGRVQGVFDARLLFLHLDFGRGPDLDTGNTAGELGDRKSVV